MPGPVEQVELPEPLAAVVDYLGDDLDEGVRDFVPTAELVDALGAEPTGFARQMGDYGCRPRRERVPDDDGQVNRVRGYLTADIRAAVKRAMSGDLGDTDAREAVADDG